MSDGRKVPAEVREALERAAKLLVEAGVSYRDGVYAFEKLTVDAALAKAESLGPTTRDMMNRVRLRGYKTEAGKMLGLTRDAVRAIARREI